MKFIETPEPIYVETEQEAQEWLEVFSKDPFVGFDTETTGLNIIHDRVKFFSIANKDTRICAPVRLLSVYKDLLEDDSIEKRMTNSKYDMHMAANHGVTIQGRIADTICMDFLIDENRHGQHGLKETAKDYLGLRMAPFSTVFGNLKGGKKQAVLMLVKMHDCIESDDADLAIQILAELGRIKSAPDGVLDGINKITGSISKPPEKQYTTKTLLSIGRKTGICNKTTGRLGFVVDVANYMGFGLDDTVSIDERSELQWVMSSEEIREDMQDMLLKDLTSLVPYTEDPIELLKLIVADYASLDAWASYSLVDVMENELSLTELYSDGEMYNLLDYYNDWYAPLLHIAFNMERTGFKVDVDECKKAETDILDKIDEIERNVTKHIGKIINLNSSAQLKEYFYTRKGKDWADIFGNPVKHWSNGGTSGTKSPSTAAAALEYFAEKGDPVANMILEHRKLKKIQEFVHNFPRDADSNGRIHSTLNIVGARTGRWSSRNPNLQNIPSKGDLGAMVRKLFIPESGKALIVADYGQLEMRIMAHYAQEQAMMTAIKEDKDIHSMTAALAGGYDYEAVLAAKRRKDKGAKLTAGEKELCTVRRNMKAVGFGLNYGIGAVKLARQLGLPVKEQIVRGRVKESSKEGQELIDKYFSVYPSIKQFIEDTKRYAQESLNIQTISGRYRRLPEVNSKEFWIRAKAQRQAGNTVIQGSAADIMNAAVIKAAESKKLQDLGVKLLLQVHDELIFECNDDPVTIQTAKEIIQDCMENAWPLDVPLEAEPGAGYDWESAK